MKQAIRLLLAECANRTQTVTPARDVIVSAQGHDG